MRWAGCRKVRRQVCQRALRRARELGLSDLNAYRTYLDAHTRRALPTPTRPVTRPTDASGGS